MEDAMRDVVSRAVCSFMIAIVGLAPGVAFAQGPTPPANAAVYEVRFSFTGHLGSLASAPDCPVRDNGTAVMSGRVWGIEAVRRSDDIVYYGTLDLRVDLDLCEATRDGNSSEDRLCTLTVVGGGPVDVELSVYADDRGGYVKARRGKGIFGARAEGNCGTTANNAEVKAFPDNSQANPFNGTELDVPSGPLMRGQYENDGVLFEVRDVIRRP
jgi:hypothetical protein